MPGRRERRRDAGGALVQGMCKVDIWVSSTSSSLEDEKMDVSGLMKSVADDKDKMVHSLREMLRIKAVGPENGGPGEAERGKYLVALASRLGFDDVQVYESIDPTVPGGKRPNIIIRRKGTGGRNLWVVTHMDTVPEGDLAAWKHPPFDGTIEDGKIYGRGSEDNGQELIASMFGLHGLVKNRLSPEYNVGLVIVSDEEHGNTHGIDFLLGKDLFKKGELAVVPDHGQPDGAAIAVVEKSIAWVNVEVIGKQTHGSTPDQGINALEVAARYMTASVDALRKRFAREDTLFDPPRSTFVPTKSDANVPNVNTIPGKQQFAFDFRVLPEYSLDDVMAELRRTALEHERMSGAKINVTFLQRADAAPRTSVDSEVVRSLAKAIELVRGVKAHPLGIGGGTCAAPFRRHGIESAVWSTIPEMAHNANEYCNIEDLVADAQVYAVLFAGENLKG